MKNKIALALLLLLAVFHLSAQESNSLRVLHLTFHKGCKKELEGVAKELSIDLTTWFIPDLPAGFFDGKTSGNALYNIGHERAHRIWDLHQDFFHAFDIVITSDTTPLSRIFLQNHWEKPLIIWICNRFDYCDAASLDCPFPDQEYYDLFKAAMDQDNVTIVAYTEFEHYWARKMGIETKSLTITPCGLNIGELKTSAIPKDIVKPQTFFLPPYHNETIFMDLSSYLKERGIPNFCGRYNGPADLKNFKGIIHLPYSFSNLALFENIQMGIPYFIPTIRFFEELVEQGNYFHPNLSCLIHDQVHSLSEWYDPKHAEIFTYFDSWDDLIFKINHLEYEKKRKEIRAYGREIKKDNLKKWANLLRSY